MARTKTSKRRVVEETRFVAKSGSDVQPLTLVTETDRYTFKNIGSSMLWVTLPHSQDSKGLSPGEIRDDFTEKERTIILGCSLYKEGQVVEVIDDLDEIKNPNSISDQQLDKILLLDNEEIKGYILKMDSIFSINRIKERIIEQGLPAHLAHYCTTREEELRAKYEAENEAPIDSFQKGRTI